jgi:hypothetical protein
MLALQSAIPRKLLEKHVVLANSGGSMELPRDDYVAMLADKTVNVVHDCDDDGQAGGRRWAQAIAGVAKICRHLVLPYEIVESHGNDLRDWLNEGHDYQELAVLAESAEEVKPPETMAVEKDGDALDKQICDSIELDVLGEQPDGRIQVFSSIRRRTRIIRVLNQLSYTDLIQLCGSIVRKKVCESTEPVPGLWTVRQVRDAIANLGGKEPVGEGYERGLGVWRGDGNDSQSLVLVGPGQAAVWREDSDRLEIIERPRAAGLKLDLGSPPGMQWYDPKQLEEYLQASKQKRWCLQTFEESNQIFDNWNWRNTDKEVVPELLTALICATWVQSVWRWRPMVAILAPSTGGKSTLFEVFATLFGPIGLLSSKSSEAGLRQKMANTSRALLCDEFEDDSQRQKILEFIRTGSKGSQTFRGTATGQGARAYGLKHICWVTAVNIEMERAPDRNRFIWLEFDHPPAEKRGKLALPPTAKIGDLGQRLLAIGLRYISRADRIAQEIIQHTYEGIDSRVVESFSVPVGLIAALSGGGSETRPESLMRSVFDRLDMDPAQSDKDETELMDAICSSAVDLGKGERMTVGELLSLDEFSHRGEKALARVGIAVFGPPGMHRDSISWTREWLFVARSQVKRYLLKGTEWERQNTTQMLKRLPGAKPDQCEVGGSRPRGVRIPWMLIEERFLPNVVGNNQSNSKF